MTEENFPIREKEELYISCLHCQRAWPFLFRELDSPPDLSREEHGNAIEGELQTAHERTTRFDRVGGKLGCKCGWDHQGRCEKTERGDLYEGAEEGIYVWPRRRCLSLRVAEREETRSEDRENDVRHDVAEVVTDVVAALPKVDVERGVELVADAVLADCEISRQVSVSVTWWMDRDIHSGEV